jgi:hypothetical protein
LDENQIGSQDTGSNQWHPDHSIGSNGELTGSPSILTRLTRNYTYEGPAYYSRSVRIPAQGGVRTFLEVERSRELSLRLDGVDVPVYTPGTPSTPYVFEVTRYLREGDNEFVLCCDNSYPTWPRDAILYSSAATDETQTNWNGMIGYLRLRCEAPSFIAAVRAYPTGERVDVEVDLDLDAAYEGTLELQSTAFAESFSRPVSLPAGRGTVRFRDIPVSPSATRWDEGVGALHELTVTGGGLTPFIIRFGLRTFGSQDGRLALNGRKIFLRGETNCCVFPETGHMPMTVEEWTRVLNTYRAYGVNCMRFHSHCPPDAAFTAADELGMLMQPELSHWNPQTALEDDKSWAHYRMELRQILLTYANHPSFVMLTPGNELCAGALGYKRMSMLVQEAKALDSTRLYANGSNNFCNNPIGPDPTGDFFTAMSHYGTMMRGTSATMIGHMNRQYPSANTTFDEAVSRIREEFAGPVFGFEVGQYEILPDRGEWEGHIGVTRPDNYRHIYQRIDELGYGEDWNRRVEATGELSLLAYREEVEAALRTEGYSGLSLLGLQDFPGQGTALVGMLDARLKTKPYPFASPERFRRVFSDLVPLALLPKYTYTDIETLSAAIKIANYTRVDISAPCTVRLNDGDTVLRESVFHTSYPSGGLYTAGEIHFNMAGVPTPARLTLSVSVGDAQNEYPVWVYPAHQPACPEGVLITASLREAVAALDEGGAVLLSPEATEEHFPQSIQAQFTTDFWSVGTFPAQSGFMGCLVDPEHPVFAGFPTEFHSNWQWWPMCQGRAMLLPERMTSLVTALDCYARMRNMGMLTEVLCGNGRLMISSMGLREQAKYPEARALLASILGYMASDAFKPSQRVSRGQLGELVR